MMRCLEGGRLLWDNNPAENAIRPITLGRKNYLFCGNHEAAANMSVICSLLATCKAHHDVAYSGGYPFSISGDIRSVPS